MLSIILVFLSIIVALIQRVFLPNLGTFFSNIDLVLLYWISVIFFYSSAFSKQSDEVNFVPLVFFSGLVFDFIGAETLGLHALLYLLSTGTAVVIIKKFPFHQFFLIYPFCLAVVSFICGSLYFLFLLLTGTEIHFAALPFLMRSVGINLLSGIILYPLLTTIIRSMHLQSEVKVGN